MFDTSTHRPAGPLRLAGALAAGAAGLWLAGCAQAPQQAAPGTRHSPAQIAAYAPAQFSSPLAAAPGAAEARAQALDALARAAAGASDDATITQALRAVAFYDTQHEAGRRIVRRVLADTTQPLPARPPEFQRAVLTAAYSFDADGAAPLLQPLLAQLATPREFAIAAYTLRRADGSSSMRASLRSALAQRTDGGDQGDPRLLALARALDRDDAPQAQPRPPLSDLLAAPLQPGLPVVYSVQRRDRRQLGLALVRDVDGRFVRDASGQPFHIPHLALALSGLPGTITLGNTPQGLFTVVGAATASNPWIGPTPFLESKLPVEAAPAEFAHLASAASASVGAWSEARYEAWLPPSWRSYQPMKEAWLAGLAGRDEMLAHGSVVDPQPYRQRSWYPGTPTDGCLMAQETWSADGRLLRSDQLALVRAFTRSGVDVGYLVVVELDDANGPVTIDELRADIGAAERQAAGRPR